MKKNYFKEALKIVRLIITKVYMFSCFAAPLVALYMMCRNNESIPMWLLFLLLYSLPGQMHVGIFGDGAKRVIDLIFYGDKERQHEQI